MNCPNCQIVVFPTDRFCEECGIPLVADVPPDPPKAVQVHGCSKCGASSTAIDAEGYCSSCGFRNPITDRDRFEVLLSKDLAGVCDRGLKHRSNEDFLALESLENPQALILAVCDGVSSSQTPELASQTAAKTTAEVLRTRLNQGETPELAMRAAIAAALQAVSAIPYKPHVSADPPSTTLVAAGIHKNQEQGSIATIGWLGDSRAYWIDPNSEANSKQLTVDDSWLNDMVSSGKMSEAEALRSPQAHAITSWLGADVKDSAEPSIINFSLPEAGYLLLCTDGLWNYVPEASQIFALIQQIPAQQVSSGDVTAISRHLVDFARSQGGHDNITVAVLYLT
ncbi:PP2C family serine/threonine-protein phosphatase [Tumidithrix elongata RA019]|uniref:PP2C family serine/threonine-protein phosphatase n=1 Tax=Tumidithrix elongata BACA0141 TaxID=2716417 RepID=A0AAW9Q227_9CYAN|nr:PP2C family serine/threonine-protein phosphatase [Tumidithrix elongata RA019]